ncbi:hypothetical protein EWM64_g9731 [Hericium alpestre]|uniref:BTB domain-containing protein n=1 Tax=Hericium alpestre TaxID=135208 RepID=A0A4Y9ZKA1_9AGAM|nr:hypothetical protein EWM64_g9731 [Hericium alpestre]
MIPRDAEAPFNKPSTDVIVRSADKVDFHVNQLVLTLASSYFEKQLNNLQPVTNSDKSTSSCAVTDRPILDVPEDALIIDFMLRCCYPITRPPLEKLEDVRAVLDAAQKYDMAVVTRFAEEALGLFEPKCPLDVLAISLRCDLYSAFSGALSNIMDLPSFLSLETKELDSMSGLQYHVLVQAYERHANFPDCQYNIPTLDIFEKLVVLHFKSEADAPFDDKNADVVLRSCDGINFHVHKNILSIASPFFKDTLNIPQPKIIEVAEDAQTLDFLLRCIYPVPVEKPKLKANDIYFVLRAAIRCDIKDAINAALDTLLALIDTDAFQAFVLAHARIGSFCNITRNVARLPPLSPAPEDGFPATWA